MNLPKQLQLILLALGAIIFLSHHDRQGVACVRTSKENSRVKVKCLKNITTPSLTSSLAATTSLAAAAAIATDPQAQILNANPKCVTLSHPYCLDIKLPYNSVALLDPVPDLSLKTFEDVQNFLDKWRSAQKLPTCWPMLQVALCSLLMPKCEEDPLTGRAIQFHQASVDICRDLTNSNKTNCKFIQKQLLEEWPSLFTCNDTNLYAKNCTNELRDLRYSIGANSKQVCQYPLVPTNDNQQWFKDIEGCSLHCKFPISSPHDQASISLVIKYMCLLGLISTVLALLLFKTNKVNSKSFRLAKVVKHCTICQLFVYIGWSLQTLIGHEVGCKPDGSHLFGQPLVANPCIISFLLTYLPSLSSLFWCAYFGKLCHEKLTGKSKMTNDDKSPSSSELDRSLSMFIYGIPLTLCVSVAFYGHIDGHGLYGICTVGQQSLVIKTIFVFVPSIIGMIYGNSYFVRIIFTSAPAVMSTSKRSCLRRILIRISAQALLTMLQTSLPIVNYFYEARNHEEWLQSIEHYVACQLNLSNIDTSISPHDFTRQQQECSISSKPFITLYYLEILSNLALGIVIASWAFHDSNFRGLKAKLIDMLEDDEDLQRRVERKKPNARVGPGLEETYHNVIDMTSPTRCVGGGGELDPMGAPAVGHHLMSGDVDHDDDGPLEHHVSIPRPTSVCSITLTSMRMSESDYSERLTWSDMTKTNFRHNEGAGKRGMTSRDVVNDVRQQRRVSSQQQAPGMGHQQESGQQQDVAAQQAAALEALMMYELFRKFNPPNLSELQSDPDTQPRFSYGLAVPQNEPCA
uniref:Smoothened n=1 Tax=Aceria tosichella TaxID=561515 RepID=A0A6G1S968_9ACAR